MLPGSGTGVSTGGAVTGRPGSVGRTGVSPVPVLPPGRFPEGPVPVGVVPVGIEPVGVVPVGVVPVGVVPVVVVPVGVVPVVVVPLGAEAPPKTGPKLGGKYPPDPSATGAELAPPYTGKSFCANRSAGATASVSTGSKEAISNLYSGMARASRTPGAMVSGSSPHRTVNRFSICCGVRCGRTELARTRRGCGAAAGAVYAASLRLA